MMSAALHILPAALHVQVVIDSLSARLLAAAEEKERMTERLASLEQEHAKQLEVKAQELAVMRAKLERVRAHFCLPTVYMSCSCIIV